MTRTNVRFRMIFTFGANLFRVLMNFITGLILAHGLGPSAYGSMAFLLGTSIGIRQLLDSGSSLAFYTFLSRRIRSRRFVSYYLIWQAVQLLVPFIVIGLLFPDRWIDLIWKGEHRGLVLAAFVAASLQNGLWQTIIQMGESQRKTSWVQSITVGIALMHLIVVSAAWFFSDLGLYLVFGAIAVEYLIGAWVAKQRLDFEPEAQDGGTLSSVLGEYVAYCRPLMIYTWVGFVYTFADPWLLQHYGGKEEQAYYAISAQMSGIVALAAASSVNVFWKEMAEAHHFENSERVTRLYRKASRILYTVSAVLTGFLMPWAHDIVGFLFGHAYEKGTVTFAIMLLYPVHQSLSHVASSTLLATGRVRLQTVTGIIFMLASIAAAYWLLASPDSAIPGLGMASRGMAIKMVVMQFVQVNALAFLIARNFGVSFDWLYQPVALAVFLTGGWLAHFITTGLFGHVALQGGNVVLLASMAFSGLVYLIFASAALYYIPWLLDLRRADLVSFVARLRR